ncbi:cupin domain-containing protein [Streptomyces sp. So13.3]|uniref:cupin domain-containing protein n=1 Tax=Streptomyces TaxID=1883 RepID=UPI001105B9A5|nr:MULTISPECIES: cupin domain-containing protein [Streptomyces]MCZ4096789.1 cupin domain-containing protein [Streptomyces sp. H39-C1]QNA77126.1 cupin domain-containing protein [Streptomyces sp. So13.3]
MNANALTPVLTRAATAETTSDPSSVMTLLADCGTDGSSLTSYRSQFTEGAVGAPAHFHTRASELFFVIGGSLQVLVDDEVKILNEGDLLLVPPHTPHAFAAAPGAEADVLFVFTPGMPRFDYLRLLGRVMRGEASPQEIKDSSEQYDNHYVDSPVWRAALDAAK